MDRAKVNSAKILLQAC